MSIFWAAISAILVFYFRESIKLAHHQRNVVSKLDAYLVHWALKNLEEEFEYKLSLPGIDWAKRQEKCSSFEELLSLNELYEDKLKKIKSEWLLNGVFEELISNANKRLLSKEVSRQHVSGLIDRYRRSIIDAKMYPSDMELTALAPVETRISVSLKMNIIALLDCLEGLLEKLELSPNNIFSKDEIFELYVLWLKIIRDKHLLIRSNRILLSRSVFTIALINFFSAR